MISDFAVRIVVGDTVETQILADGRPVITDAFDAGPPLPPEHMFSRRGLHAGTEPHGAYLAYASCGEGCCGNLDVTIVREGDTVVWRDWRGSTGPQPPPELRFDATQYERELTRAEADRSWEWPARTVERLVRSALARRRGLIARWECEFSGLYARPTDPGNVELRFYHPRSPRGDDRRWVELRRILPAAWAEPPEVADRILHDLEHLDPKDGAEVMRGDPGLARELGLSGPRPGPDRPQCAVTRRGSALRKPWQ